MIDDLGAAPSGLVVSAVPGEDGIRLLVAGEVNVISAGQFREYLTGALDLRPAVLIVDLGGVTFLDSTGLSALVYAHNRAQEEDIAFAVVDPRPQVRRLLDVTGLLTVSVEEEGWPGHVRRRGRAPTGAAGCGARRRRAGRPHFD